MIGLVRRILAAAVLTAAVASAVLASRCRRAGAPS
jgi:hypothetical protein